MKEHESEQFQSEALFWQESIAKIYKGEGGRTPAQYRVALEGLVHNAMEVPEPVSRMFALIQERTYRSEYEDCLIRNLKATRDGCFGGVYRCLNKANRLDQKPSCLEVLTPPKMVD